ncbi:hypothetical protein ACHHYP_20124 [Achlya hypogyna]|uniref:Carbohydrate kinase n=1 Tax=Achlya hypogyna TaxID=1202772 RepID=A0A1V9ZRJ0_ACHHY|nr:hypothetical protein ACHHYP_20124 [Achlya hypogyna]
MVRVMTTLATLGVIGALTGAYLMRRAAQLEEYEKAKEATIVVVDIGSSSVRASAYVFVRGEWVAVEGSLRQQPMRALQPNGTANMSLIQAAVECVLDGTTAWLSKQKAYTVVQVGFSSFAMSLVGVNSAGSPITPVYTYAGQGADEARELSDVLAKGGLDAEIYDRTGAPLHPAYAAPQLLRRHRSEHVPVHKWQSVVGVLLRAWTTATGPLPMSYSEASWTGLLDFRSGTWNQKLLELSLTDPATMPPVQDPSTPVGHLNASYARRWPLLGDATFFLAFGDGAVANVGAKCTDPSRVCLTIGTSAAMRVLLPLSKLQKVPRGLWCYRVDATHVLLGGALTDGGSLYAWAQQTLTLPPDAVRQLTAMPPASHGLTMLPFLHGERAPGWHPKAACTISGITSATTPVHLLRATFEAVALRLAAIYSLLALVAAQDATIVASGTALTSSALWRQMIADAIGRKVELETDAVETTSRGVAILLGAYTGKGSVALPLSTARVTAQPSLPAHAAYLAAREAQEALYQNLYHK